MLAMQPQSRHAEAFSSARGRMTQTSRWPIRTNTLIGIHASVCGGSVPLTGVVMPYGVDTERH